MKSTPFDMNRVVLRGKVTGIYSTPKVTRLYLAIKDFQQKANENGWVRRNNVAVTFYGYDGAAAVKQVSKGEYVEVSGVIQNTRDVKTGKWSQECWGLTVDRCASLLERYSDGNVVGTVYPEDENLVILRGKVVSVHLYNSNWVNFTIKTRVADPSKPKTFYNSTNSVSYFSRTAVADANELERPGAQVLVIGKVEGVEKEEQGKKVLHENVVVRDYSIINLKAPDGPIEKTLKELKKDEDLTTALKTEAQAESAMETEEDLPLPAPTDTEVSE